MFSKYLVVSRTRKENFQRRASVIPKLFRPTNFWKPCRKTGQRLLLLGETRKCVNRFPSTCLKCPFQRNSKAQATRRGQSNKKIVWCGDTCKPKYSWIRLLCFQEKGPVAENGAEKSDKLFYCSIQKGQPSIHNFTIKIRTVKTMAIQVLIVFVCFFKFLKHSWT